MATIKDRTGTDMRLCRFLLGSHIAKHAQTRKRSTQTPKTNYIQVHANDNNDDADADDISGAWFGDASLITYTADRCMRDY